MYGTFNRVYRVLMTTFLPPVYICDGVSLSLYVGENLHINDIFSITLLPCLVNVVFERPLTYLEPTS